MLYAGGNNKYGLGLRVNLANEPEKSQLHISL
jgi:hypothetical protein